MQRPEIAVRQLQPGEELPFLLQIPLLARREKRARLDLFLQLCPHEGRHGVDEDLIGLDLIFQRRRGSGALQAAALPCRPQHEKITVPDPDGVQPQEEQLLWVQPSVIGSKKVIASTGGR